MNSCTSRPGTRSSWWPLRSAITAGTFLFLTGVTLSVAADAADSDPEIAPTLSGRLAWLSADRLDLVADLEGDVPFIVGRSQEFWFDFGLRTAIEETTSQFNFKVRDIEYYGDVGWRARRFQRGLGALTVYFGQRGKELVDTPGGAWIRYVAVGLESRRYRQAVPSKAGPDLQWNFGAGPVLDDQGISADLYVRGNARFRYAFSRSDSPRPALAFDVRVDGIVVGGEFDADVAFGPGLELPTAAGERFLVFAHYQISEHPLGIGEDAWLVGLEYSEGQTAPDDRDPTPSGADLSGSIAWGAGRDDRFTGQLFMRFLSPEFGRRVRLAVDIDVNVLTSADVDDLYWRYDVGLERVRQSSALGLYLYHRSNHRMSQSGDGSTGRNVAELGIESDTWNSTGRRPDRRGAKFDYRLRLGYLVNSSFDEDQRWNLRGGARWSFPLRFLGSNVPFVSYEFENGDIDSSTFAVGISPSSALDFQLEFRDDDQYFSTDQSATLVTARFGF